MENGPEIAVAYDFTFSLDIDYYSFLDCYGKANIFEFGIKIRFRVCLLPKSILNYECNVIRIHAARKIEYYTI